MSIMLYLDIAFLREKNIIIASVEQHSDPSWAENTKNSAHTKSISRFVL